MPTLHPHATESGHTAELISAPAQGRGALRDVVRLREKTHHVPPARHRTRDAGELLDPYCAHAVVRDRRDGTPVAACRLLDPEQAARVGGYDAEDGFDLTRLVHIRPGLAELSGVCLHPAHRDGRAERGLWAALDGPLRAGGWPYLLVGVSLGMADGGRVAASFYRNVARRHLSPVEWRVFPRYPLPFDRPPLDYPADRPASDHLATDHLPPGHPDADLPAPLPPLVRATLRAGGYICGEPSWHPERNTADLLLLLPLPRGPAV